MPRQRLLSLLTGAIIGVVGGLTGVGGGPIMVPMLTDVVGLSQHQAHGTSLAAMVFMALAAALVYAHGGYFDGLLAAELAIGSAIGVVLGARWMVKVPVRRLRQGFGVFLIVTSVSMFFR